MQMSVQSLNNLCKLVQSYLRPQNVILDSAVESESPFPGTFITHFSIYRVFIGPPCTVGYDCNIDDQNLKMVVRQIEASKSGRAGKRTRADAGDLAAAEFDLGDVAQRRQRGSWNSAERVAGEVDEGQ